jgi:iron(III) transport system substrate-binding protein
MKRFSSKKHHIWVSLVALSVIVTFSSLKAFGADYETEQQNLYRAAKGEGKVVLYTSGDSPQIQAMLKAFEAKYPGIKAEFYRSGSGTVQEKLLSEHEAKIYSADVLLFHSTGAWFDLKKDGFLLNYDSPIYNDFPRSAQDPGYTVSGRTMATFHGYNTNLVPEKTATTLKTMEDWVKLAEQKEYRGRFGTTDVTVGGGIEAIAAGYYLYGEQKTKALFQRLFAAGLRLNPGGGESVNAIVTGQEAFDFFVPQQRFYDMMSKGAPIRFAVFTDGQPLNLSPMSIYSKSPHPNSAKLLFNWWNSKEGQALVVENIGCYSARPGAPAPKGFPPVSELKAVPIDRWAEMGKQTDSIIAFFDQMRRSR